MGRNRHDNSKGRTVEIDRAVDGKLQRMLYELNPALRPKRGHKHNNKNRKKR